MKKYNKYIVLAALAMTFAACTQDEDLAPQADGDAVRICATIGKLETRVSYDDEGNTSFVSGDQIQVENTKRTTKNKATYTYNDYSWSTSNPLVWNGSSTNQFEAWYPVTDYSSFCTFELPSDQSDATKLAAADWMTAGYSGAKPDDGTLHLAFTHLLTKITIQVTEWRSEYDNKEKLINNAKIYSLANDIKKNDEGAAMANTAQLTEIIPLFADQLSYTAIVCPGTYTSDQKIMTFTVNDEDYEHTVMAKNNKVLVTDGLKPGNHYTFNLTVGKEAASISEVSVTPWGDKDVFGGVAEEVVTP